MTYPVYLDRADIERQLPHRGEIFVCQNLVIESPHNFTGLAIWPLENSIIQGHFPGVHIVPGALLIDAAAQLAGAGVSADGTLIRPSISEKIGVLASIRRCTFRHPAPPQCNIEFLIRCRQMTSTAIQVDAKISVKNKELAQIDFLMTYISQDQLISSLNSF